MNYKFAYSIGFHPWEDAERHGPFVKKITEMFEREESGKTTPFGKALDIGCGNGVWGINLAKRGWDVTGVDIVDKALQRAQERIEKENVAVKLVKDDVTELHNIGKDFKLILDTGTFHGLTSEQKKAMGNAVNNIAGQDATILLLVWDPKWRGPLPGGASRKEIEACFPDWTITHVEPAATEPEKIYKILKANEQWYRLCRK
ncbi:class I SAM-dependent methyltransferase [Arenibacter sp. TNZ]|uniref:class I SAM-dependent methyltransferase n=1 Tax=Arenibacter TaxID=178469 RepID=UPI000CD3C541|nr:MULTISPECIES: class I SAM-dependent methyltransferase [Arenibacter]MCM4173066.1 class I SAM-dependent methyltransferase [Arenibacter sp. TNZ]